MNAKVIPWSEAGRATATKERILDAAETLFMEHGFEATSLRVITAAAGVNLAAVELSLRQQGRAVPGGAHAPARPDEPGTRRAARPARSGGRAGGAAVRADPGGAVHSRAARSRAIPGAAAPTSCACSAARTPIRRRSSASSCREQYAPMIGRFKDAFGRALPHLPARELSWRLHFIMGALSYTLAGTDALKLIAELNPVDVEQRRDAAAPPRAVPAGGSHRATSRSVRRHA